MQALLLLISFILSAMLYVVPESGIQTIIEIQLFVYVALIIVNFANNRRINLFQVWLVAFIFMIHSEMLILADYDNALEYLTPIFFFLISNNLVLVGYLISRPQNSRNSNSIDYKITNYHLYVLLLLLFYVIFIWNSISEAQQNLLLGRQLDETIGTTNIWKVLANSMGIILPSLIAFLFKDANGNVKWLQWILVLPIFILHVILATRFKLLFSFVPFCIISGLIDISKPNWKTNASLLIILISASILSSFMKDNRYKSLGELGTNEYVADEYKNSRWSVKLAAELSPEGIIQVAKYADDYFKNHDLRYGLESTNIFYRWIPRKLWPNKPTTLDHWLIRYYEDVPDTHSTSSGFIGIFRADFGWFALIFAFFIGLIVAKINAYMEGVCAINTQSIEIVMAAAMIPLTFFIVRSPITSTYTLLFEYFIYLIIRTFTTDKTYNIN